MGAELHYLSNGIPVAIDVMPQTELASLGIFFQIGTRFESKETNGAAHFLEHMFLKGTQNRTAEQLFAETEGDGISLGAYTMHEQTYYTMSGLGRAVPHMIDLLADILIRPALGYKQLNTERGAVLQEIVQDGDDLENAVTVMARKAAYPRQAFGADILGPRQNIRTMSRKTLMDFMKEYYHSGNMLISVAGNIDPQTVLSDLEKAIGHLPRREKNTSLPAVYKGGYRHLNCLSAQFHLKLAFNSCASNSSDYWDAEILASILGSGMSSRLFQEIRTKRGLVYDVSAVNRPAQDTGMLEIYAATDHKDVKKLIPVLCDEIRKMRDQGISERELARAKNQMMVYVEELYATPESRMEAMADQITTFGQLQPKDEIIARINAVTVESVNAIANRILSGKPTLATAGNYRRAASYENVVRLIGPS